MAKKTSKKSAKKATPRTSKKAPEQTAAAPSKKVLSKKLDQLRKKFLQPKTATAKKVDAGSDATVTAAKSAREIVKAAMPGVRVLDKPSTANRDAPLQTTGQGAGLDSLRKKYGGPPPPAGHSDAASAPSNSEVVMVESGTAASDDRGPGPKAIIVENGRIIARQG